MTQTNTEQNTRPGRTYAPKVDILETDSGLRLWAEMPGVDEKSIEVELVDGVLSIRGRVATEEYANLEPLYTEYGVGNFETRFRLANTIDGEHIHAKLQNGVLELELPKVAAAKPRRIEIAG
ncbi:MAG TPA: Hsp20/alpha crystallin family protein [Myxococcota bacterium]|nr:Hsp20/alpha crystallin family protein [Myxococcota bacterium]